MVNRNINDIKNPYDYLKHQIKENADRDNLVQEVLVAILSGFGFDLDRNGATMLALVTPKISSLEILANMIKVGDTQRQLITLDRDSKKLVLIDPEKNQIKNLEALSNTFNNIVIGTTKYTPNAGTYSLRIIQDPTNGVSVGITDSTGTEAILPTKVTVDALKVDITTLQSQVKALETDNNANKLAIQQNKTATDTNKGNIQANTQGVAKNTGDISKNTQDIATNKSGIATNTADIATNTQGIATNKAGIATNKSGVANNKASVALLTASAVTELKSTDNSVGLIKTSNAQGSITYNLSTASAPVNGVHSLNGMTGNILEEASDKSISIVNSTGKISYSVSVSADANNGLSLKSDGLFASSSGGSSAGVSKLNDMTGEISCVETATTPTITISKDAGNKELSFGVKISSQSNNGLSARSDGLFASAGSGGGGGVTTINTLKDAVFIKGKTTPSPSILIEENTADNSLELSAIISPSVNNALSITPGGLFVNSTSPSGGASADDTKETIYLSSTGADSKTGTLLNPVKTPEKEIQLMEAKKTLINQYNDIYGMRKGDSSSDSRNISGNVITEPLVNGKVRLNWGQSNLVDDSSLTFHITKDVDNTNDKCSFLLNGIKSSTLILGVDVVATSADQADQMTYIFDISKIYKNITETQPTILIKKIDAGDVNQVSCVKRLNLFLNNDIIIEEGLTSSGPVRTKPIIAVDQTNFGSVEVFIHLNNKSQSISGVGDYPAVQIRQIEPVQIIGTAPTDPPSVSVNINTEKFSSKLFIIADYTPFTTYQITSDYKQYYSSASIENLEAQNLILPTTTTRSSSIAIGNQSMKFKDSGGGDHVVADKQYVQDELTKFRSGSITLPNDDDAMFFYGSIIIDPIASSIMIPKISWNALAGQDYQSSGSTQVDQKYPNFQTIGTAFTYRANPVTTSGGVLPRQQWLSEWTGTGTTKKQFFGIAHMLVESGSTVSVVDAGDTNLELHTLTFTSAKTLEELKRTFIKGTWLEIAEDDTKQKFVTAVISGDVIDAGSGSFTLQCTFVFTNSKLQAKMYTLAELNNVSANIYINPFPSVIPSEAPRFKSAVANNDETSITQNYFIVGAEGDSDILKEGIMMIPYSPAYASLKETTKRENIGQFLMNSSKIQQPVIDKLLSVWGGGKASIGICPMPINSHTDSDLYRDLLGGALTMVGNNKLEYSYIYSKNQSSLLFTNNPTELYAGMKSIAIGADQKINSGYQLASFLDGNDLTIKVSSPDAKAELRGFLEGEDVASSYIPSSYSSLANCVDTGSQCITLSDLQLRNLNAIIDASSEYKTLRSALFTDNASLKSITLHIDGWQVSNAIYSVMKDRQIMTIGVIPNPPSIAPTEGEMTVLQHADAIVGNNKGILYKQDGTASGILS